MVKRKGGFRRHTRSILGKNVRQKGKLSLTRFLQQFKVGDRVLLNADSAHQKGMYFPRFHGKSGKVQGKRGNCYEVLINDMNKEKTMLVHPVHLKKL